MFLPPSSSNDRHPPLMASITGIRQGRYQPPLVQTAFASDPFTVSLRPSNSHRLATVYMWKRSLPSWLSSHRVTQTWPAPAGLQTTTNSFPTYIPQSDGRRENMTESSAVHSHRCIRRILYIPTGARCWKERKVRAGLNRNHIVAEQVRRTPPPPLLLDNTRQKSLNAPKLQVFGGKWSRYEDEKTISFMSSPPLESNAVRLTLITRKLSSNHVSPSRNFINH